MLPTPNDEDLSVANATIAPRDSHAEFFDPGTSEVWLSREPVTRAWFDALEPPGTLVKSGFGRGEMDRAWFLRSPGAVTDGPLRTRTIADRTFQLVARPDLAALVTGSDEGFPRRFPVHKHHVLVFAAGRTIPLLEDPAGCAFVPLVAARRDRALALPAGWRRREITLDEDWLIELPAPTDTWWVADGSSFQGPGALPRAHRTTAPPTTA